MWQGEVPSRLVVGMVKSQAFNGDYNLNPYHFEHFDVSNIGFFVNGESTPRSSFKLDVENGIYLQGLNSLYKITGKTMENSDIGITRETYRQGYTLIGFDVDPTTSPDFRYVVKVCPFCGLGLLSFSLLFVSSIAALYKIMLLFGFGGSHQLKGTRGKVHSRRPRYYVPCSI